MVSEKINSVRDLDVYKLAFEAAMEIFQKACEYIDLNTYNKLDGKYEHILTMLNNMEMKAEKFCFSSSQQLNFKE